MALPQGIHVGRFVALEGAGPTLRARVVIESVHATKVWRARIAARVAVAGATGAASAGTAHTHPVLAPLAAGDDVLVAFLEGRPNAPVVIDRLPA